MHGEVRAMRVLGPVTLFIGALAVFGAFFARTRLATSQTSGLDAAGSALLLIGVALTIQ